MNWFLVALKKYAVMSGRARRKEYWFFILFSSLISLIFPIFYGIFNSINPSELNNIIIYMWTIYMILMIVPNFTVTIRRLHDTNHSAWWLFLYLIPFAGALVIFIFMVIDGDKGPNRFGEDPKAIDF